MKKARRIQMDDKGACEDRKRKWYNLKREGSLPAPHHYSPLHHNYLNNLECLQTLNSVPTQRNNKDSYQTLNSVPMLLKTTKKFFQRTIKSFKSFLSGGYQRLPKTPPFKPFSCGVAADNNFSQSYRELDKFYTDRWDGNKDEAAAKKEVMKQESGLRKNYNQVEKREEKKKRNGQEGKRKEEELLKRCLVTEKLKELEMMDVGNMEHVVDIEEILYYYSRLTCPPYLDIVDRFFLDMYSELFNLQPNNSRPRLPSLKF